MCMKMILSVIVSVFVLFTVPIANATDVTISWQNATKNTDGSDIPIDTSDPGALASTTIYWGACLDDDTPSEPLLEQTVLTTVPGQQESTSVIITTPGRWCFIGEHKNNAGSVSDLSNPAFKEIASVPMPPDNLMVQDEVVYYVVQRENRFALLPVGTIPVGTGCVGTEYVNGFYVVPREEVTWSGNTQPLVVVAQCSP